MFILVIEDEALVAFVIQAMLNRAGFKTLLAKSLEEAAGLLLQHQEQLLLVLSDTQLPDGLSSAFHAQHADVLGKIPFIAMSGNWDSPVASPAKAYYAQLGITRLDKPFRVDLVDSVQQALALQQG